MRTLEKWIRKIAAILLRSWGFRITPELVEDGR